jgi:hypothetical protein
MHIERTHPARRRSRHVTARRVWAGFVRGTPDCWVVVARDEYDLVEWFHAEEAALDASPLRICRAILDDGVLLLEPADLHDGESPSDPDRG